MPEHKMNDCDNIFKFSFKYWIHDLLVKFKIPICHGIHGCPCFRIGKKRKQKSEYNNDEDNHEFCCKKCQKLHDEYWDAMWEDYNSGRL